MKQRHRIPQPCESIEKESKTPIQKKMKKVKFITSKKKNEEKTVQEIFQQKENDGTNWPITVLQ